MSAIKHRTGSVLDIVNGLPETTAEDCRALRTAAATPLGPARASRLQEILGRTASREELAKRRNSIGAPFSL